MSGKVPLSSRAQLNRAVDLYENFTGHRGEHIATIRVPDVPKVVAVVGEVEGIIYNTTRDGNFERYIHEFKKSARPVLAVTPDGKQLLLIGGDFEFTERGIVDN